MSTPPPLSRRGLLLGAAGALACSGLPGGGDAPLQVFAAASLADVLPEVAGAWRSQGGEEVRFGFDATSRIAHQVEQGAGADLVFCADEEWMRWLQDRGLIEGDSVVLLGNTLVLVTQRGRGLRTLSDAARLGLAGPEVPAGRYARAALESSGEWAGLAERVVPAESVRAALAWAARGEVDAAVVYGSDAAAEPEVEVIRRFEGGAHPPIHYVVGRVRGSEHLSAAAAFLDFCHSPAAAAIFGEAGFPLLRAIR